ncbi:MAG: carbon starvation CstA family protein [Candidatus Omnitrophica bacterium]|nr:carbon starvation CstA family protein [Candidatus Omnitrophota bacterium]MDD5672181.1 carbon starvation CstA family protein [Candidatus Omnitrophota bacterium]
MNLLLVIVVMLVPLAAGYWIYGSLLRKLFHLDDRCPTPAHTFRDGLDFQPTNRVYLLGQHLSAIAAAGPIVGPILAGMWFGWGPAIVWIILGGVFIGGVHDMSALVASIRHQGKSIAEVVKAHMPKRAFILFLIFLWLSLMYIITAFADITVNTFVDPVNGPAVASSSMMYLGLALIMGIAVQWGKLNLKLATAIFTPLILLCIYAGRFVPITMTPLFGMDARQTWCLLLLLYCFIASVIPVWLLLQPRGYLGGFFLTGTVVVSFVGIVIGSLFSNLRVEYPFFVDWHSPSGLPLFPLLFITVACGACSGFHSLVASGTTSRQLDRETDSVLVGYGGMLLESVVAIIALATVMIFGTAQIGALKDPNMIYGTGIATFLNFLGINKAFALNFALLAFATFVYDTLDVATRLGRYIFEELGSVRNRFTPYLASFITLLMPAVFLAQRMVDADGNVIPAWKVFWTVFGASNQLLAGFVLFIVSLWLFRRKMKYLHTLGGSIFMLGTAFAALVLLIKPAAINILAGRFSISPVDITVLILLALSIFIMIEGAIIFVRKR